MKMNQGKIHFGAIIIILLIAILLAVTNPKKDTHVAAINDTLDEKGGIGNVITRGLLAVKPPLYQNLALLSYTRWNDKITSIGVFGYVWVNNDAFK